MALASQRSLCLLASRASLLNQIQVRFSLREDIHKYREPNKFKKHMLHATQPYIKSVYKQPSEICKGPSNKRFALHPLEQIYRQELVEAVSNSEFMLVFQYNFTPFQSERVYKNTLIKSGGLLHIYNNNVYKAALLEDLAFKELENFFITRNGIVTGATKDLPAIVNAFKKMYEFILLAGYIGKQLYEIEDLIKIAATTDLTQCRQNLVGILTSPSITLADRLQLHSQSIKAQSIEEDAPHSEHEGEPPQQ